MSRSKARIPRQIKAHADSADDYGSTRRPPIWRVTALSAASLMYEKRTGETRTGGIGATGPFKTIQEAKDTAIALGKSIEQVLRVAEP